MKNISKFIFVLLVAAVTMPAFQSCKKGPNDPAISFKSRKARLVGEWSVTKGTVTSNSSGTISTETYDGSTYTYTSGGTTTSGTYTYDVSIIKDGKFTVKCTKTISGSTTTQTYEGFWYFEDANSALNAKNKQRVALQWTKETVTSGTITNVYTYSGDSPDEYFLDELKSKEMIWKRTVSVTGSSTSSEDITYTLTKK